MTKKLYYHRTDGGAEYLCTSPVEGTDEGDLWTTVVRLDGEPELMGKFETIEEINAELLEALKAVVDCPDYKGIHTHEMNAARAAIRKAEGN